MIDFLYDWMIEWLPFCMIDWLNDWMIEYASIVNDSEIIFADPMDERKWQIVSIYWDFFFN